MTVALMRFALRMLHGRRKRLFLSALGAMIGISLLVSLMVLYGNLNATLEKELQKKYGMVDLMVGYRGANIGKTLTPEQVKKLGNIPEISQIGGAIANFNALFKDNRPESMRVIYNAVDNSPVTLSYYKLNSIGEDEVALSANLAKRLNVKVSDHVNLLMPGNKYGTFKVNQIFEVKEDSGSVLSEFAFINLDTFQRMYGNKDGVNVCLIRLHPNASKQLVSTKISSLLGADLDIDKMEGMDREKQNIENLRLLSFIFGGLAVLAGAMFVLSNFRLSLRERFHELAIMRAIGSSKRQIFFIVLLEAFIIGMCAAVLGLLVGVLVAQQFYGLVNRFVGLEVFGFFIPWSQGIGVALMGWAFILFVAMFPAWKTANILPIELIRESNEEQFKHSRLRIIWVGSLIVLALVLGGVGFSISEEDVSSLRPLLFLVSGLFFALAIMLSIPNLVKLLLTFLEPLIWAVGDRVSLLAVKNLLAERKQSALTVFVLSLAPTLFFSISIVMTTMLMESEKNIKTLYLTPFKVSHVLGVNTRMDLGYLDQIHKVPGVQEIFPLSIIESVQLVDYDFSLSDPKWREENARLDVGMKVPMREVVAYRLVNMKEMMDQGWLPRVEGDLTNQIFLTKEYAKNLGLKPGDTIMVKHYNQQAQLKVAGVVEQLPTLIGNTKTVIADWKQPTLRSPSDYERNVMGVKTTRVESFLIKPDPLRKAEVIQGLQSLVKSNSDLQWSDFDSEIRQVSQQFWQRMAAVAAATGVVWVIGLFGGMTTLSANLLAKRREYAILRAISMTPKQLTQMVIMQSVLFGAMAFVIGAAVGFILAYAFSQALNTSWYIRWDIELWMIIGCTLCFMLTLVQPWLFSKRLGKYSITKVLTID